MKTLRRSLLVLLLTIGAGACSSGSILGPEYAPDGGNYAPDGGNYAPDGGNYAPDGGN